MLINREKVLEAVINVRAANAGNFERSGAVWEAYDKAVLDCHEALRALPVSDGWEDIATAPRQVWLLCWGPDAGSGVAKYPFNIIGDEWPDYTHWRPLPAPPTIEGDKP